MPWVADPATAAAADPQVVTNLTVDLNSIIGELDEARRLLVAGPYLRLVRNAAGAHPDHAPLHGSAGFLFRRFDAAEAARYAERSDEDDGVRQRQVEGAGDDDGRSMARSRRLATAPAILPA